MILTEAEAATKDCCGPMNHKCVASKCMAWRWGQKSNPDYRPSASYGTPEPAVQPAWITDTSHGYCGLAGPAR